MSKRKRLRELAQQINYEMADLGADDVFGQDGVVRNFPRLVDELDRVTEAGDALTNAIESYFKGGSDRAYVREVLANYRDARQPGHPMTRITDDDARAIADGEEGRL